MAEGDGAERGGVSRQPSMVTLPSAQAELPLLRNSAWQKGGPARPTPLVPCLGAGWHRDAPRMGVPSSRAGHLARRDLGFVGQFGAGEPHYRAVSPPDGQRGGVGATAGAPGARDGGWGACADPGTRGMGPRGAPTLLWEMWKIPRAWPEEEVGHCSPRHHEPKHLRWGHPRAGWKEATIPPQRWMELLPQCRCPQAALVGFWLGTGLSKLWAPWGKHVRIHLGLFGESEGRLTPKAGRAEGFLLPPRRVSRRIPWEELHFPTTASHEPGLLGARGGGKSCPGLPENRTQRWRGPGGR